MGSNSILHHCKWTQMMIFQARKRIQKMGSSKRENEIEHTIKSALKKGRIWLWWMQKKERYKEEKDKGVGKSKCDPNTNEKLKIIIFIIKIFLMIKIQKYLLWYFYY